MRWMFRREASIRSYRVTYPVTGGSGLGWCRGKPHRTVGPVQAFTYTRNVIGEGPLARVSPSYWAHRK